MERSIHYHIRNTLSKAGFFQHLKLKELDLFIQKLKIRHYMPGDAIVTQGEKGNSFHMISEGTADVIVRKGLKKVKVAKLESGDYFGEMSLLTGEKRNATVIVTSKVLIFTLYKADFDEVCLSNPRIVEVLKTEALLRKKELRSS